MYWSYQTDMLTVYICLQDDNITRVVFTQSVDVQYRGFLWSPNHNMPFVCYFAVSWNMTEILTLVDGHAQRTLHHMSLSITCYTEVFVSTKNHAAPFVCWHVPEHALPRQWTGTIAIHYLIHTIVSQPKHLLCCQQEHYRSVQDVYINIYIYIASLPVSTAPKHKHSSCAGGESMLHACNCVSGRGLEYAHASKLIACILQTYMYTFMNQ